MQAISDHKERHPEDATAHYVKAAIAAAVAVGAYEMLKRDEEARGIWTSQHHGEDGEHRPHARFDDYERERERGVEFARERSRSRSHSEGGDNPAHDRHLLEEAVGAYALGRQILGHNQHPILKLVAEALGASGLYQEVKNDFERH